MVWMSATLAMIPLLLVFYFSVVFLNRGIDSWFHVEIRAGLQDALTLSRAALDLRMRENLAAHRNALPKNCRVSPVRRYAFLMNCVDRMKRST